MRVLTASSVAGSPPLTRHQGLRRAIVAVSVCVAAVIACVRGFFSPVTPELTPVIEEPPPRLAPRVLWIVVDGLRHDTALELGWMPNLMSLSKQGASGTATTTAITMTGVGVRAMSTGMSSSLFDLARNWSLPRVTEDNLFRRLRDRGDRAVALGNETWFGLFPDSLARATTAKPGIIKFARPVNGFDRMLTRETLKLAAKDDWQLAVLHYGGVDNASHMWTPLTDKFRAKITEIDNDIARVVAAMGPSTAVMITSDHGTSDRGNHGGIDPVERITPLVLIGPGIRRGAALDAQQVDLPAVIAALLGLQVPAPIEGHVLVDALDLTPVQAAALRASEARRHERYASAYADQFSTEARDPNIELSAWLVGVRTRWIASLAWAIAMIAAAAWVFGLARGREQLLSAIVIAVSLASIGLPPSIAPALVAVVALCIPLVPQLAELRGKAMLGLAGLVAIQTAALVIHTYERVIHGALRNNLDVRVSWLGVVALAACAPFVWRACRSKQVAPWAGFALVLAFAMPGDDAALWGVVLVGGVAAIASWNLEDDWGLLIAIALAVVGFWIRPSGVWAEIAAPAVIAVIAALLTRQWPWLVAGAAASALVAFDRPMLVVFPALGVATLAAIVVAIRRGELARIGWGAAIVLGMLSHSSDVPGLIGLVLVCDRIGRLERLNAFGATVICIALRFAFILVFEGRLAFGNLEIWLGYVAGNEHTVLGALLVFTKFLLPFVVVLGLALRSLELRSAAITGCVVFLVLRIAEIVIGLCTAQGTFYGPYRDVAQLALTAGLLVTLLVASLVTRGRRRALTVTVNARRQAPRSATASSTE